MERAVPFRFFSFIVNGTRQIRPLIFRAKAINAFVAGIHAPGLRRRTQNYVYILKTFFLSLFLNILFSNMLIT